MFRLVYSVGGDIAQSEGPEEESREELKKKKQKALGVIHKCRFSEDTQDKKERAKQYEIAGQEYEELSLKLMPEHIQAILKEETDAVRELVKVEDKKYRMDIDRSQGKTIKEEDKKAIEEDKEAIDKRVETAKGKYKTVLLEIKQEDKLVPYLKAQVDEVDKRIKIANKISSIWDPFRRNWLFGQSSNEWKLGLQRVNDIQSMLSLYKNMQKALLMKKELLNDELGIQTIDELSTLGELGAETIDNIKEMTNHIISLEKLIDNIIKELTQSSEICATINKLIWDKTDDIGKLILEKKYAEKRLQHIECNMRIYTI